ncbi:MAG: DUF5615 family PIN-like protein [Dehalococcoidia bacterium]
MRLYIDEDVSREVVTALEHEHDVTYSAHAEHKSKTDAWHLQQASVEQRVLLTHNASDFRFLHRVWTTMRIIHAVASRHAGVLMTSGKVSTEQWIRALRGKLSVGEDFGGRLLIWDGANERWLEDKWRPDD